MPVTPSGRRFAATPSFLTVCLNPTLQKTYVLDELRHGEVNRAGEHRLDVAGKGVNTSRILRQSGETEVHLTHAGGRDRELLLSLCRADKVNAVAVPSASEIRYCHTLVDRSAGTTTEIVEQAPPVAPSCEMEVRAAFTDLLGVVDVVIISGSKAPGFTPRLYPDLVAEAVDAGKLVVIDYRGEDLLASLPNRPSVIKPNLAEFVQTFLPDRAPISEHADDAELLNAVARTMLGLRDEFGVEPIVTRGKQPTLYLCDGGVVEQSVEPVTPVNTIGCGDAVTAGVARVLRTGGSIAEAVAHGHELASRNAVLLRPGVIE